MKTVLVPGAPWPKVEPFVPLKRKATVKKKNRKVADANFLQWLEKMDAKQEAKKCK